MSKPTIEKTDVGEQYVLPGTERATQRQMIERQMAGPMRPARTVIRANPEKYQEAARRARAEAEGETIC